MGLIVGVILAIIYRKKALSDQNTFMKSKNWVLNSTLRMYWEKVRQEEEKRNAQEQELKTFITSKRG